MTLRLAALGLSLAMVAGCAKAHRSHEAKDPYAGHGRARESARVDPPPRDDPPPRSDGYPAKVEAASDRLATPPMLATAGVAVRSDPATIDVDATVAGIAALGCNAYLYDVPHGTDAWAKLDRFLTLAADRKIDVYVYLFPWTLAHRNGRDESNEPYDTDYLRWSDAIGALAERHPNLRGLVMDDFQVNADESAKDKFTPAMVRQMRATMRKHRDDLQFIPVLYFDLPTAELLESFGTTFDDGAIMCYPHSTREIEVAQRYLNDQPRGASLSVELPKKRKLRPGQGTFAGATLDRDASKRATTLKFFLDDQNATAQRGRHRVVVRVDGRDVWSRELSGASVASDVSVPLRRFGNASHVEIGIVADEPNEEASVHIAVDDVRVVDADDASVGLLKWRDELDDGIDFDVRQPSRGDGRWHIPMTLLVAGVDFEHEKRFHEPGTPQRIAGRVQQALDLTKQGIANGVIAWYAPLGKSDATGKAIGEALRQSAAAPR